MTTTSPHALTEPRPHHDHSAGTVTMAASSWRRPMSTRPSPRTGPPHPRRLRTQPDAVHTRTGPPPPPRLIPPPTHAYADPLPHSLLAPSHTKESRMARRSPGERTDRDIATPQRDSNDELRLTTHQTHRNPNESGHPATRHSFPSPPTHVATDPDRNDETHEIDAATAQPTGNPGQLLFTPAQAAAALQVRESWLRRRAARRDVPCTFLGKHLRFSRADLDTIVAQAARQAAGSARGTRQRTATRGPARRHRELRPTPSHRPAT